MGLQDRGNTQVWSDFCGRYGPILVAFGRRLGLSEADAHDAGQDTLLAFAEAYRQGRYDRSKGRLRTWLYGIATNKIRDMQRARCRERVQHDASDGEAIVDGIADDRSMSEAWEAEWQRWLLRECVRQVRDEVKPTSMRVFELCVLDHKSIESVADELGMSHEAVLRARSRVLARIRRARETIEAQL